MKTILLIIAIAGILSLACEAQVIYNIDLKRGNANQYINIAKEKESIAPVVLQKDSVKIIKVWIRYYAKFALAYVSLNGVVVGDKTSYGIWQEVSKKDYDIYKSLRGQNIANPQTGDVIYVEVKQKIIK